LDALRADDVVSLKADITQDSSHDKAFLVELGQGTSIPLIVVFAPGSDEPYVLQGFYSRNDVLGLIEQARADGLSTATTAAE